MPTLSLLVVRQYIWKSMCTFSYLLCYICHRLLFLHCVDYPSLCWWDPWHIQGTHEGYWWWHSTTSILILCHFKLYQWKHYPCISCTRQWPSTKPNLQYCDWSWKWGWWNQFNQSDTAKWVHLIVTCKFVVGTWEIQSSQHWWSLLYLQWCNILYLQWCNICNDVIHAEFKLQYKNIGVSH